MTGTDIQQSKSIGILLPYTMFTNDSSPNIIICSKPGIKVTKDDYFFILWKSSQYLVQLFIELIFRIFRGIKSGA